MHAYRHGIIVLCADGIVRRLYPRFFTYSADYPEKYVNSLFTFTFANVYSYRVLIACIKYLGRCPCPRCLTETKYISAIGTNADMQRRQHLREDSPAHQKQVETARTWIFDRGWSLTSERTKGTLEKQSLTMVRVCISIYYYLSPCSLIIERIL